MDKWPPLQEWLAGYLPLKVLTLREISRGVPMGQTADGFVGHPLFGIYR